MKIVVSGGLGYVGSALLVRLARQFPSSTIVIIDNLYTGQLHALDAVKKLKRVEFYLEDIRKFNYRKLKLKRGDHFIHLAGLSRPLDSYSNEKIFQDVNTAGALKAAQFCANTGASFLFPSTTSIYAGQKSQLLHESSAPLKPQTPYASSKLSAEQGIQKIQKLNYVILRFGTIFGASPVFSIQTAVNKFCWQAATDQPLSVWKTALHQLRPYLEINDAVRLITAFVENRYEEQRIYHAATCNLTVSDIVTCLKRYLPSVNLRLQTSPAMNPLSYGVDCSQLTKQGIEFKGSFDKSVAGILAQWSWLKINK